VIAALPLSPSAVAVIVAVPVVRVMEVSAHYVVDVARVRNGLVPAGRAVSVRGVVLVTRVPARAPRGIGFSRW